VLNFFQHAFRIHLVYVYVKWFRSWENNFRTFRSDEASNPIPTGGTGDNKHFFFGEVFILLKHPQAQNPYVLH